MKMTNKAKAIIKLLKQGYSPSEITKRMDASYNYAWKLKTVLDKEKAAAKAAKLSVSSDFLESLSRGKGKPKPEPEVEVAVTTIRPSYDPEAGEYVVVEGAKSAQEVDAILNARGSTYGSFVDVSRMAQRLKNVIRLTDIERRGGTLPLDHQEALDMIASKIARIVVGDYDHVDSWVDIAGYATLVADRLQGKVR